MGQKEYNYEYEDGRVIRATESDILISNEIVTQKVIVNTIKYYYDSEGMITKKVITSASGSVQTIYYENSEDNTVVKFNAGGKTITAHSKTDSFGRKVFDELQLGTGFVSRQFHYHAGDVTEEHKQNGKLKSSATTQLISQIVLSGGRTISYEYDEEERITKVDDSVDGITTYTYDALGQLLTETLNGTVVNTMTYDNYGNIRTKNGVAYTYGDEKWKDLLTAYNGQPIVYDAQGNPTEYLGHTLTWEKGRQLKSFDSNTYTYNANGIRTSKTVYGIRHNYILDGVKILRETWNGNTLVPIYDNEDSVCGIFYNNQPYYFQKNLQGDIIGIVDKDSKVVAQYKYDAWGVPTITQDTTDCGVAQINPYRYRGYYYDVEIGMYYLQSRYYNSIVGRFVNGDILLSKKNICGTNLFSYCNCSPIKYVDSFGTCTFNLIAITTTDRAKEPPDHPDFKPPKKGNKKVQNPNGRGKGWEAKDGGVWVWTPGMHGGDGWTVQYPNGNHKHAYPGGKVRSHWESVQSTESSITMIVVGVLYLAWLVGNDISGIGAADDGLIPAGTACVVGGISGLYGQKVCTECGQIK